MKMFLLSALLGFVFAAVLEAQTKKPTVAEAEQFMNKAEARLAELSVKGNQANWIHENFITEDSEGIAAAVNDEITAVTTELVEQAKRFDGLKMPAELERKFLLLKLQLVAPAPKDPKLRKELTTIAVSLDSDYGKGKFKDSTGKLLDINEVENIMFSNQIAAPCQLTPDLCSRERVVFCYGNCRTRNYCTASTLPSSSGWGTTSLRTCSTFSAIAYFSFSTPSPVTAEIGFN